MDIPMGIRPVLKTYLLSHLANNTPQQNLPTLDPSLERRVLLFDAVGVYSQRVERGAKVFVLQRQLFGRFTG